MRFFLRLIHLSSNLDKIYNASIFCRVGLLSPIFVMLRFARILFEPLCGPGHSATASSPIAVSARLKVRSPTARLFAQLTVPAGRPRILHLVDLLPATAYNVSFDQHKATFTTLPLPTTAASTTAAATAPNPASASGPSSDSSHSASESSAASHLSPLKLLFVSCDRWLEDGDSSFFDVLAKNERNRFGIVHMGDQIYADSIARVAASLPRAQLVAAAAAASGPTAENQVAAAIVADALAAFRDMYRRAWSRPAMRRVLRVGAHFMLPDDHDVINNLDPRMLNSTLAAASASASASAELATANALVVAAGRQAYFEYQQQLRDDWTAADDALTHAALRLDPWRAALAIGAVDPSTNPTSASSAAAGVTDEQSPSAGAEHQDGSHGGDGAASATVASFHLALGAAEIRGSSVYMSARQLLGGDGSTVHSAHFSSSSSSASPSSSSSKRAADDATTAIKKTTTPVYFARQMGATGVIFLDLRFQRTFAASKNATLLGANQLAFVRETMEVCVRAHDIMMR